MKSLTENVKKIADIFFFLRKVICVSTLKGRSPGGRAYSIIHQAKAPRGRVASKAEAENPPAQDFSKMSAGRLQNRGHQPNGVGLKSPGARKF